MPGRIIARTPGSFDVEFLGMNSGRIILRSLGRILGRISGKILKMILGTILGITPRNL